MQGASKKMSKPVTENTLCKINNLLGIDESYKAPGKMLSLILNAETAKELFFKFLEAYNYDLSYEWFNDYFMDEHADRKNKKQDFTPTCLSRLMSEMIAGNTCGIIYEPACGTGSTLIQHWYKNIRKDYIWNYNPMSILYYCEELADKTIPFLLFNLLIRGMNAIVIHRNTLTRKAKNIYHCFNEDNNAMGFSTLYVLPKTENTEKVFGVTFYAD